MRKVWIAIIVFFVILALNVILLSGFGFQSVLIKTLVEYGFIMFIGLSVVGVKKIFRGYGAGAAVFVACLALMLMIWALPKLY